MNEMRKLMEAVESLYEDTQIGFKNITVSSMDWDDIKMGDETHTARTVWIYDQAGYDMDNPRQRDFTKQDHVDTTGEDYNELVATIADIVKRAFNDTVHKKDEYSREPRYVTDFFAIGADVSPKTDKRLIHDVLSKAGLSDVPSTLSDDGEYVVLNVEHPELEKKRWWQR